PRLSAAAAAGPNASAITSNAGRAWRISSRVHSGFASSGREARSSFLLPIPLHLFPVCLAEADDVRGITPLRDDGDMQAPVEQRQYPQSPCAVALPRLLHRHGRIPFKVGHQLEGQTTLRDIPVILGGVEGDAHTDFRYYKKCTGSRIIAVAEITRLAVSTFRR